MDDNREDGVPQTVSLAIGLLVHNESDVLPLILGGLRHQTVFGASGRVGRIDLFVVPNGCTDDSASVARTTLESLGLPAHVT